MAGELDGLGVVVTRPREQAERVVAALEAEGARAFSFPLIAIEAMEDPEPARRIVARLESFDLALFVSANAVRHGLALVRAGRAWPPALPCLAIGRATARAIAAEGLAVLAEPRVETSEGLLELPALAAARVRGRRVALFRGQGGRPLLARALRARGATVEEAIVYRRTRPAVDVATLVRGAREGAIDAILITSGEALEHLLEVMGAEGRAALDGVRLVVAGERLAALARERGFGPQTLVASGAGEAALVEALCRHAGHGHGHWDTGTGTGAGGRWSRTARDPEGAP